MTLNHLADELRENVGNRFDLALLTIVENLADLDDGDLCSYSCGNIGINLTKDYIELVDIDKSTKVLGLRVEGLGRKQIID